MQTISNVGRGTLKQKLVELIRTRGSMTVAEYMRIVLTNPESGFYMNNDVFGVKGHFTTSPEISQMFGEVLGAWVLQEWHRFNRPEPLRLVEFGPGRGTLMSDITRTLDKFKLTHGKVHVDLIEMSPHLRGVQAKTLENQAKNIKKLDWHNCIEATDESPDGFTVYIAHEFIDALPVHKFVRDPQTKKWRELLIDYDQNEELRLCISKQPSLSTRLLVPPNFEGDHLEVCPEGALVLEKVAKRLNNSGKGCALVCDYGFEHEPSSTSIEGDDKITALKSIRANRDTFRAFKNHEPWPPLRDPGHADLTADVDFGYLKKHLQDKALIFGPVDQANFLVNCGIYTRLNMLLKNADNKTREDLESGADMMIKDMGERYKFLAIFPMGTERLFKEDPPAGFITVKQPS